MFNPRDLGYLLFRVLISAMMLTHGVPKLMALFSEGPIQFLDPIGIGMTASFLLVVFAEFACSIFIILGFKVRLASIPLAVTMAVAFFVHHGGDPWKAKEKAALYLASYIVMALMGSGKLSIDEKINR